MTDDLFRDLHAYYDAHGIGAERFHCPNETACRGTATNFSTAKEAYVGDEFGRDGLPRLVFLSLDSGDGGETQALPPDDAARARSLEALQAHENRVDVRQLHHGRHWYQTRALALALLAPLRPSLDIDSIHHHFAHTNSAKCCLNKPHRAQADSRLFDNCRQFIPGELEILMPDILVTQGRWAQVAVRAGFGGKIGALATATRDAGPYRLIDMPRRSGVVWLHCHHPKAFGLYRRQKEHDWQPWRALVLERFGRASTA